MAKTNNHTCKVCGKSLRGYKPNRRYCDDHVAHYNTNPEEARIREWNKAWVAGEV